MMWSEGVFVMNLFFVDRDPGEAARSLVDAHVLKQILETAQLLDVCLPLSRIVKPRALIHHPHAIWVRESSKHHQWLLLYFKELLNEYTFRFSRAHAFEKHVAMFSNTPMILFSSTKWRDPPKSVSPSFESFDNIIIAYRYYYAFGMKGVHRWTKRAPPQWMQDVLHPYKKGSHEVLEENA